MKSKIIFILCLMLGLAFLLLFVFGNKFLQFKAMSEASANAAMPPTSVSTHKAEAQSWARSLSSVGTVEPIRGIVLEAEAAGIVDTINFENGQKVAEGDLLIQFDIQVEKAQRKAAVATARLAEVEFERAERLRKGGNVPQSDLDQAIANLDKAKAEVENIQAVIDRKTIRAPFSGRLGIRQINLGQYVSLGSPLVSLQSNDQVYVNFTLPQQSLHDLSEGLAISLTSDAFPDEVFEGKLTAISPQIDPRTRAVSLQGTLDNPDDILRAGLFVKVSVKLPKSEEVIAVPKTSVVYAPYGNSLYVVTDEKGILIAKQKFVRTGRSKGDFVDIAEGLEAGEDVISAGTFKVFNGAPVSVHNEMAAKPELSPTPDNN